MYKKAVAPLALLPLAAKIGLTAKAMALKGGSWLLNHPGLTIPSAMTAVSYRLNRAGGAFKYLSKKTPNSIPVIGRRKLQEHGLASLGHIVNEIRDKGRVHDVTNRITSLIETRTGAVGQDLTRLTDALDNSKNSYLGKKGLEFSKKLIDENGKFNIKNLDTTARILNKTNKFLTPIANNKNNITIGSALVGGAYSSKNAKEDQSKFTKFLSGSLKGGLAGYAISGGLASAKNRFKHSFKLAEGYSNPDGYWRQRLINANNSKISQGFGKSVAKLYTSTPEEAKINLLKSELSDLKNQERLGKIKNIFRFTRTGNGKKTTN